MLEYYARRAGEYEAIYRKPERRKDLAALKERIAGEFQDLDVLELAAGTGYWTETLARSARSVLATDAVQEVLDVARSKAWPVEGRVRFEIGDAWNPAAISGRFTGLFCGFLWSHIPVGRLGDFLRGVTSRLEPGGLAVFIDNNFVQGSSTPVSRRDEEGNSYQERHLEDGTAYEVLKNFPDARELESIAGPIGSDIQVTQLKYFWHLSFRAGRGACAPRPPEPGAHP